MSSQARREQIAFAIERGHSQRRACELLGVSRCLLDYRPVRAERDAPAIAAMKRLAYQYPRYGYRRIRSGPAHLNTIRAEISGSAAG